MNFSSSFNVCFSNVRGLGAHNDKSFRTSKISPKILELVSSNDGAPTLYALLETKLKPNRKTIKLPNNMRYITETSSPCGSSGILIFLDKRLNVKDRAKDVFIIHSKHAIFVRVYIGEAFINNIIVYLPSTLKDCLLVIQSIEMFLTSNNINEFCMYGDFNIDFNSHHHKTKASKLKQLLDRFNLFDLSQKLNKEVDSTWRGTGLKMCSKSKIDHFFCNFNAFNSISFKHNSFSDHLHVISSFRKQYIYCPPPWKAFLFKKPDFRDILKIESIIFLYKNADPSSKKHDLQTYLENPSLADNDFNFSQKEYGETNVFFALLNTLKKHHDRYFSQFKSKNFNKSKQFDHDISNLFSQFDSNQENLSIKDDIKTLIQEQQQYYKDLVYSQAETKYMSKLQYDGHNNSLTFKHIPKFKRHEYKLKIGDDYTVDNKVVVETLAKMHAKIVCPDHIPNSTLDDILHDFDLSLEDVFPKITTLTNPFSSTQEFKKVLKTMKQTSAPGISTQPKVLFEFLLDILPNFTTNSLNKLYTIDIDKSPFAFIKDRNVVFIPKKDCDLTNACNYRPISLLENIYKLLSKALNKKLTPFLPKLIHSSQFGFCPNRNMSTASLNLTTTMQHISKTNDNAQLISFDFSKAFDKTLQEVTDKIFKHIFPNGTFADAIINITNGGRFRAVVSKIFSNFYSILRGSPQGDPFSSSKFIILNHIFIALLKSSKLKNLLYKIGKNLSEPGSYADDVWCFFQLKSEADVQKLTSLLKKLHLSVGLEINFNKTKILVNGPYPTNLPSVGTIEKNIKHLGLTISFNFEEAKKLTYDNLFVKLEERALKIPLRAGYNLFKRRNLCNSLLSSMCYHIYRVYPPNMNETKKLWKIISKFLWSIKKVNNVVHRIKVSQKRIEMDFTKGGLNFLKPENQAFCIWLNSLFSALKHSVKYPDTNISKILEHKHVPIKSLLNSFSFKTLIDHSKILKLLYPASIHIYFEKACEFFHDLESDKDTFFHTPIFNSQWSNIDDPFTISDQKQLRSMNRVTIASIFESRQIGSKTIFLPSLDSELKNNLHDYPSLLRKLEKLISAVKISFPLDSSFTKSQVRNLKIPLISFLEKNSATFSLHFKRLLRTKNHTIHPAIISRQRDNKYFPDHETFFMSFKKIFKLPIVLHHKNLFFEQFCRTLPSKNKLFKFNILDSNICAKCKVVSDSEHALFSCLFAKYFVDILAKFLDFFYNDNVPQFVLLKENFYLYNIYFEEFSINEYLQLTQLILIAKDKCLKFSIEQCIEHWTTLNFYCHTLLIIQFASKLLINCGNSNDLILSFYDYVINNKHELMNM